MPFTISHAAAVLPLRRIRQLPWVALMLGSFGPDFEYFLHFTYKSRAWHYFPDILLYCFPFTLACYYLFHAVIKRPTARLLPLSIQRKLHFNERPYPKTGVEFVWLLGALLIGLATHVAWDSLTHPRTWPWQHFHVLRQTFEVSGLGKEPGYSLAQIASSIVGLVVMIAVASTSLRNAPVREVRNAWSPWVRALILGVTFVTATVFSLRHAWSVLPARETWRSAMFHYVFVIGWISLVLWTMVGFGLAVTLRERMKPASRTRRYGGI